MPVHHHIRHLNQYIQAPAVPLTRVSLPQRGMWGTLPLCHRFQSSKASCRNTPPPHSPRISQESMTGLTAWPRYATAVKPQNIGLGPPFLKGHANALRGQCMLPRQRHRRRLHLPHLVVFMAPGSSHSPFLIHFQSSPPHPPTSCPSHGGLEHNKKESGPADINRLQLTTNFLQSNARRHPFTADYSVPSQPPPRPL